MTDRIGDFRLHQETFNGTTTKYAARQEKLLREFQNHVGGNILLTQPDQYREWMMLLTANGQTNATVHKNARCVRAFFTWAHANGVMDATGVFAVPLPKPKKGQPRPYSRDDMDRFWEELEACFPLNPLAVTYWLEQEDRKQMSVRMRAHFRRLQLEACASLAVWCGLRREEIFNLTVDDVHPYNEYVVVRDGKGGEPRTVPYPDEVNERIDRWFAIRDQMGVDHLSPWLVSRGPTAGNAAHFTQFSTWFAKFGSGWELHRFRHTCATEWLRAGMSLQLVSRLLGHRNITQTLGYAAVAGVDVKAATITNGTRFAAAVGPRTKELV